MAAIRDSQAMGTTTGIPCERGHPDLLRLPRLLKGQSGGKRRVCGASGHPEPAREPPQDWKRLLNSPSHSVLSPNLLQSFSGEVGSVSWFSCRLLGLPSACARFPPEHFQLPAAQAPERVCDPVCLRAPGGSGTRRKGRTGRGVWDRAGRAALEAPTRRVPGPAETCLGAPRTAPLEP